MPSAFAMVCVVLLFVFVSGRDRFRSAEKALDILERRYAKGEVTTAQYLEMKHMLQESRRGCARASADAAFLPRDRFARRCHRRRQR